MEYCHYVGMCIGGPFCGQLRAHWSRRMEVMCYTTLYHDQYREIKIEMSIAYDYSPSGKTWIYRGLTPHAAA